jgi:hypothetical protein
MKLKSIRAGRLMSEVVAEPDLFFLACERDLAEEAWRGAIASRPDFYPILKRQYHA